MQRSLSDVLLQSGGVLDGATSRALHFGSAEAELRAALRLCVVADRSHFARVLAEGSDLLDLLQRLGTGDVAGLSAGEGKPTVLTTPKGRIVERLFVHHLGDRGVLLAGGGDPTAAERTIAHLDRYTFAEKTGLSDMTQTSCQLAMIGPRAGDALGAAGFELPAAFHSVEQTFEGTSVQVIGQDGLSGDGFSVVAPCAVGGSLWQALRLAASRFDGRPAGELALQSQRILLGLPADGHELTADHNPLEAGLRDAVSFDKGCYVGQEVVARLENYDKVSRSIRGLWLAPDADLPEIGAPLFLGDRQVGTITSAALPPGFERPVALAYVKQKHAAAELELRVGSPSATPATLAELPFELPEWTSS